jgi:hypothetical protein
MHIHRAAAPALSFTIYLALSLIFFGTAHGFTTHVFGYGGDSITSVWCLKWWPWAIAHGENPFFTRKVSIPALALLGWPLTWLGGAIVSYNVYCLLAAPLAAFSAFLLARYLTRDSAAAFIAGYIYGFSAYESAHLLGHLNLAMTCLVPILLLVGLQRLAGEMSSRRCIAWLSVLLLVQFGISLEVFCTSCVFGAVAWGVFLLFAPRGARPAYLALARDIAAAMAIVTIAASPFLFFLLRGLRRLPATLNPPVVYAADPVNFLVPTAVTRVGATVFASIAARFPGGLGEQGAYLGLPLAMILTAFFARRLAVPAVKGLLVVLLVLIVCSLGPLLWMNGMLTGLHLPWAVAMKLPLIRAALPGRFTLYVFLLAGLIVSLWLSENASPAVRVPRLMLAAVACLFLLPNRGVTGYWAAVQSPPFFDMVRAGAALRPGQNVLLLPVGPVGNSMIWQMQADFRFTQAAGYTGLTPPSETADPNLQELRSGAAVPDAGRMILAYCRAHAVSAIIAGPGTPPALMAGLRTIGWAASAQGGVVVFSDPVLAVR